MKQIVDVIGAPLGLAVDRSSAVYPLLTVVVLLIALLGVAAMGLTAWFLVRKAMLKSAENTEFIRAIGRENLPGRIGVANVVELTKRVIGRGQ